MEVCRFCPLISNPKDANTYKLLSEAILQIGSRLATKQNQGRRKIIDTIIWYVKAYIFKAVLARQPSACFIQRFLFTVKLSIYVCLLKTKKKQLWTGKHQRDCWQTETKNWSVRADVNLNHNQADYYLI